MVVRIHNTDKWKRLDPVNGLVLKGEGSREIRLQVNASAETVLSLLENGTNREIFLWRGINQETIIFRAEGTVDVVARAVDPDDLGAVWYFTDEGENTAQEFVESVPFVKIAQRRARNPEFERMAAIAEINAQRRIAAMEQHLNIVLGKTNQVIDQLTGEVTELKAAAAPPVEPPADEPGKS